MITKTMISQVVNSQRKLVREMVKMVIRGLEVKAGGGSKGFKLCLVHLLLRAKILIKRVP
jgi:hypothetical protein